MKPSKSVKGGLCVDCSEIGELLSGYIDDCIEDKEKRLVENHINQCAICKREYELLKAIVENSRKLGEIDLPCNFEDELRKKLVIEKHNTKSVYKSFIYRYRAAAAGFLALTLSLGMLAGLGILNPIFPKKSEPSSYNTAAGKADMNEESQEKTDAAKSMRAFSAADTTQTEAVEDAAKGKSESGNRAEPALAASPKMAKANGNNSPANTEEEPQSDGKTVLSAAAPDELFYDLINVNLNADEYKAYMDKIDAFIKSLNGFVKNREPLQYALLKENKDEFINKLSNDFKIQNVKVTSISLAEEYGGLLNEVSDIENQIENSKDSTSTGSLKLQYSEKESEIKKIEDLSKEIIIQINRM